MTHQQRLEAMYKHLPTLGLGQWTFAPLLYRVLWKFGLELPPPHFTPFAHLALLQGTFMTLGMSLFLWIANTLLWDLHGEAGPIAALIMISGTSFGLAVAFIYRAQARKRRLPLWYEYRGN
jgi:hypothetical protein